MRTEAELNNSTVTFVNLRPELIDMCGQRVVGYFNATKGNAKHHGFLGRRKRRGMV